MPDHFKEKQTMRVRNTNFGSNYGESHFRVGVINQGAQIGQQTINLSSTSSSREDLLRRLDPILDASHTRDCKRSPPDSKCFPGTREEPIREIIVWADCGDMIYICTKWKDSGFGIKTFLSATPPTCPVSQDELEALFSPEGFHAKKTPHIYWLHGFAGCGKSSISLEGAGDRKTAPLIQSALTENPGLATGDLSLATQLDSLILSPLQNLFETGALEEIFTNGPFLIVVDGLDECEDKQGVEEFIDHMLAFFENNPSVPLRLFVASRVEERIRERLSRTDEVQRGNLDLHSPEKDIEKYLHASFQAVAKRDRVIQAYVKAHEEWPTKSDMSELIEHIGGSFVLASTIFKFIVQRPTTDDPLTPMERFPLTLKMNGLDDLYSQTLARSQPLSQFSNIISTITLLHRPLSVVKIAELLHIETFEVLRVLLHLQGIIHVPGTDNEGEVTLCHKSLRDFLTTESRSGPFFVPPSFHLCMAYYHFDEDMDERLNTLGYNHTRPFIDHLGDRSLIAPDAIKSFTANQSLFVDRLPAPAFLCSMFWYLIFNLLGSNDRTEMFEECAHHLALALECPHTSIRRWLLRDTPSAILSRYPTSSTIRFTEKIYEAMQRASTAMNARFPEYLEVEHRPAGIESRDIYGIRRQTIMSGIEIFKALRWILARARYYEEANISPDHSLNFTAINDGFSNLFMLLEVTGLDETIENAATVSSDYLLSVRLKADEEQWLSEFADPSLSLVS
ncbi:hypothetical protein MD484_g6985, partial [Candolleomyces efflorescens]